MLVTGYWAEPLLDRKRSMWLYSPTLDSMIDDDDPVRLLDEVMAEVDWSDWESRYNGHRGQPPIHPRYIASAILHGMYRGIRSSRKLEEACTYRFDFIWLVEGLHIDHSTFATFRTQFRQPLKDLFRQIGCIAMTLGLIRLGVVGFDGTRVKANNSRYKTRTAKTLEEKLQALDDLFEHLLAELQSMTPRKPVPTRPRTCLPRWPMSRSVEPNSLKPWPRRKQPTRHAAKRVSIPSRIQPKSPPPTPIRRSCPIKKEAMPRTILRW